MNLENLTVGEYTQDKTAYTSYLNPYIDYTIVATLPIFRTYFDGSYNIKVGIETGKLHVGSSIKVAGSYNLLLHALGPLRGSREYPTITHYINKMNGFIKEFDKYMETSSVSTSNISISTTYLWDTIEKHFNNKLDYNSSSIRRFCVGRHIKNNMLIGVSTGLLVFQKNWSSPVIPLIALVIKNEYIREYKFNNLLGGPINTSMFEFWVNEEIENILDGSPITGLSKMLENKDNIEVVVKRGMTDYQSTIKTPQFESIGQRFEWLTSVKNSFMNEHYMLDSPLEVKEFPLITPKIETVTGVKFRSRTLNTFVKGNKQKHNKYTLI